MFLLLFFLSSISLMTSSISLLVHLDLVSLPCLIESRLSWSFFTCSCSNVITVSRSLLLEAECLSDFLFSSFSLKAQLLHSNFRLLCFFNTFASMRDMSAQVKH
uniref:Secreted protein n=1 Tax=Cacopsylla melanoneura TaxID=428564 RepID=A0A8D8QAK2_9HEMI